MTLTKSAEIKFHSKTRVTYIIVRAYFSWIFSWLQLEYDIKSCRLRCWCVFAYIKKSLTQNMWNKNFFYYNTKISPEICTNSCRLMGFSITCETKYNSSHSLSKDLLFLFLSGRKQIFQWESMPPFAQQYIDQSTYVWEIQIQILIFHPGINLCSRCILLWAANLIKMFSVFSSI